MFPFLKSAERFTEILPNLIADESVCSEEIIVGLLSLWNHKRLILGILTVTVVVGTSAYIVSQFHPPPQVETVHIYLTTFSFGFNTTDIQDFQDGKVYASPTLTVHKGQRVVIEIRTLDFTHGFAIDEFNVQVYVLPGQIITVSFLADKVGNFTYYCNVFCGIGHPYMHGIFQVLP